MWEFCVEIVLGRAKRPRSSGLVILKRLSLFLRTLTLFLKRLTFPTLEISNLLFIEAVGNYVKVSHLRDGQVHTDMIRATMKQMEETLQGYPMIVRCHRAFLVNLGQVEQIVSHSGSTQLLIKQCHESLPVSRSNMAQVRAAIKRGEC